MKNSAFAILTGFHIWDVMEIFSFRDIYLLLLIIVMVLVMTMRYQARLRVTHQSSQAEVFSLPLIGLIF